MLTYKSWNNKQCVDCNYIYKLIMTQYINGQIRVELANQGSVPTLYQICVNLDFI